MPGNQPYDPTDPDYDPTYPSEPIGGGNPYYRCTACKKSGPSINGRLSRHWSGCEWVRVRQLELSGGMDLRAVSTNALWVELIRREAEGEDV
jgi:hypothetical protein